MFPPTERTGKLPELYPVRLGLFLFGVYVNENKEFLMEVAFVYGPRNVWSLKPRSMKSKFMGCLPDAEPYILRLQLHYVLTRPCNQKTKER